MRASQRDLGAHRHIVDALERRDADGAAEWTHKHRVDVQRGFARAGPGLSTLFETPA